MDEDVEAEEAVRRRPADLAERICRVLDVEEPGVLPLLAVRASTRFADEGPETTSVVVSILSRFPAVRGIVKM